MDWLVHKAQIDDSTIKLEAVPWPARGGGPVSSVDGIGEYILGHCTIFIVSQNIEKGSLVDLHNFHIFVQLNLNSLDVHI